MKVIGAIEADFERGPLGLRSRLREMVAGEPVLRHTLRRACASGRLAGVHLIESRDGTALAREIAGDLAVKVETTDSPAVPWAAYVTASRKWALDGWRGGVGDSTVFDESINPWVLEALARREGADAVAVIPAGAALFDAELLDRMIEHFDSVREDVRMVFTQTAPGLSGAIYSTSLLADLARAAQPPGRIMAYRPNDPQRDMVSQSCYYAVDAGFTQAYGRCLADTDSGFARIGVAMAALGTSPTAEAVSAWLEARRDATCGLLPVDVEIELTTDDPLPASTLRPRGAAVPARGRMAPELFERLVDELATRDDSCVTLGGFGDPLLHPELPAMVRRCREAGIFGLAVRTSGVRIDDATIEALTNVPVDVLEVFVDALTPETYRKLHGADCHAQVTANVRRVLQAQQRSRGTTATPPLVICAMCKTRATMDEMERFYDGWLQETGAALIVGPSAYAGQWPDLAVMNMAPPTRFACARLFNRAMILADGTVTACDQDFRCLHPIGSVHETSLAEIWQGPKMEAIRESHRLGGYNGMPLCASCREWHRP